MVEIVRHGKVPEKHASLTAAARERQTNIGRELPQKIYCKSTEHFCHNGRAMTYLLPPLNPLRAFEAAARHLSFKLAAHELHVTPGAVGQHVKALEDRLGVRLFERLHKQLILTPAGQAQGVAAVFSLGVYARFDLARLRPDRFRATHPTIGLRIMEPAGLPELVEGKVDVLIDRSLGHHPGYRCDRLETGSGVGDYLVCPVGTANCPENETLRAWLRRAGARRRVGSLMAVVNET